MIVDVSLRLPTRRFEHSAHYAAYLNLAQQPGEILIAKDLHLFNAVHVNLEKVIWIGNDGGI